MSNDVTTTLNYDLPIPLVETQHTYTDNIGSLLTVQEQEINYNAINREFIDGAWTDVSRPMQNALGTGESTTIYSPSYVYAFGPKGEDIDLNINGGKIYRTSNSYYKYNSTMYYDAAARTTTRNSTLIQSFSYTCIDTSGGSEIADMLGEDAGDFIVEQSISHSNQTKSSFEPSYNIIESEVSGGGSATSVYRDKSAVADIFADRYLGFAVAVVVTGKTKTVQTVSDENLHSTTVSSVETPSTSELIVKHRRAGVVMRLPLGVDDDTRFTAYSASDPLTGAVVVNVQRLTLSPYWGERTKIASWIFVVDETGVKTIHDLIPGLPQDVRVKDNKLLITV